MSRSDHYYTKGYNAQRMEEEAVLRAQRDGRSAIIHHHRHGDDCHFFGSDDEQHKVVLPGE